MTTVQPPPAVDPPLKDPLPNKAIAALVTGLITFGSQWAATGSFQFDQEGITAIGVAAATVLVYYVSNWKKKGV
jgi:hypothetical protein